MNESTPQQLLPVRPYVLDREPPRIIPRGDVPVELRWQLWHDDWCGTNRDLRWYGMCIVCGRNVWAFDDDRVNSSRDVLGGNALVSVTGDDQPRSRTCGTCINTYDWYEAAVRIIGMRPASEWEVIRWPGMDR